MKKFNFLFLLLMVLPILFTSGVAIYTAARNSTSLSRSEINLPQQLATYAFNNSCGYFSIEGGGEGGIFGGNG